MGIECPVCGTHASYTAAITATGEPAKTNSDIIARKLSCGHVVGSKEYMKYRAEIKTIENNEALEIAKIKEGSAKARLAVWAKITASKKEA